MKLNILRLGVHNGIHEKGDLVRNIDPCCSSITLIQGEKNILVDTGNLAFKEEIIGALTKEGVKAEDIDFVINTHLHFDHCSNNHLFTNAKRIAPGSVWTSTGVKRHNNAEDVKIPGVKIIQTPGHTLEHISVIVSIEEKTYVLSGDAINIKKIPENNYSSISHKKEIFDSINKILAVADIIIPGHGDVIEGKGLEEFKELVKRYENE